MESLALSPGSRPGGVALLEAMFAVAIFGLVVVSLLGALRDLGQLSAESGIESAVLEQMHTLLEERLRDPRIQERIARLGPDDLGVSYSVTVDPARRVNLQGKVLDGLYRIRVQAEWLEGTRRQTREAETLRYASLYR